MAEKVLIVDDDVQTLRLVGLMLERQGYRILAANSGAQAIHMARLEHPDVIVLDVMMPDFDGYEVSRRLRKDPDTTDIPILMFTARTQVEDKVTGYEAGADDYLTKPVHPSELSAHLRSLLARSKSRAQPSKERGYVIGVLAAKGGLGVSTFALNLALAFHQKTKSDVIAAELRPGMGTWGAELGDLPNGGLANLLRLDSGDISPETVERELARFTYGIRLLLASPQPQDAAFMQATNQIEAVIDSLPDLAQLIVLDIGTPFLPAFDAVVDQCNELIVLTEPFPAPVQRTRLLLDSLGKKGFGQTKLLQVVSNNRIRADVQLSLVQMQEILGTSVSQVIPPAPEIAYQAATRNVPFIQVQIGSMVSQQYQAIAERIAQRIIL